MKQGAYKICIFSAIACFYLTPKIAIAQIIPDTTLPNNSTVTPQGNTSLINGGTRAGNNLFHSFQQFSIPTGTEAHFNNSLEIQNIFSRVTGGTASNIDGLIQVNGTANLFLLNPHGIIFGSNARLNIGGSFIASTANSIKFADGIEFSATTAQTTPLLTVNVPIGLQFGATSERIVVNKPVGSRSISIPPRNIDRSQFEGFPTLPPEIIVNEALTRIGNLVGELLGSSSGLQVNSDRTLALVGGDIALEGGRLRAGNNRNTPGGRIEIGSVASGSSVSLNPTAKGFALGYEGATGFRNISLSQGSFVDVSGSGGGEIQVWGDRITLTDTSAIFAGTLGNGNGGEFSIFGEELTIMGNSILGAVTINLGRSTDISINVRNLTVQKGFIGSLSGSSQGNSAGDAGNLTIDVTDTIELRDALFDQLPSGIFAATGDKGKGGNITISTGRLLARDGAQIAVTTGGSGKAGTVQINARESVQLIGDSADNLLRSGIYASSFGNGDAGNLIVETGQLTIQGGAAISAATRIGAGGNVTVKVSDTAEVAGRTTVPLARNVELFASDISANTLGSGKAGDVFIQAGRLIVRNGARITAETRGGLGTGPAGNLTVEAGSIYLDSGTITAETKAGNFGNISLQSENLLLRRQSQITTNATGTGGNIRINTGVLAALENSDITANSIDSRGGQIMIKTQGIFGAELRRQPTPTTNDITASSQQGPQFDGIVEIQTPDIDPTQGLVNIPGVPESPNIVRGCQPTGPEASSFTNTGTGGLPPNPTEPFTSQAIWRDTRYSTNRQNSPFNSVTDETPISQSHVSQSPTKIVEAQGWMRGANGEIILIADPAAVTPYSPSIPIGCYGK